MSDKQLKKLYENLFTRCYSEAYLKRFPSYEDVTVCEEWKEDKQAFFDWVQANYYVIDGEPTVQIDHDILIKGNKVYCPEACIFVPKSINTMFSGTTKKKRTNTDLPMGVEFKGKHYKPNIKGHKELYNTPEEAFKVYKEHKEAKFKKVAEHYKDVIPEELYEAMINWEINIDD